MAVEAQPRWLCVLRGYHAQGAPAPTAPRLVSLGATTTRMGAIPTVEERTTTARPKYNVGSASTRGSAVRQGPSDFEWALDADASEQRHE